MSFTPPGDGGSSLVMDQVVTVPGRDRGQKGGGHWTSWSSGRNSGHLPWQALLSSVGLKPISHSQR